MKYKPAVYEHEGENDKENDDIVGDMEFAEHLRFSTDSYRRSLEQYNRDRYSETSERRSRSYGEKQDHHGKTGQSRSKTKKSIETSSSSKADVESTIALFGAYGVTGHYFLKQAVEAGYHVRVLMIPGVELIDFQGNPNVTLVTGTFDDKEKIYRLIRKAAYVVCMLNDCRQTLQDSSKSPSNYDFVKLLVPMMGGMSPACRVLLYQASSFASSGKRDTPMLSNVAKKVAVRKKWRETYHEQDRIVKFIVQSVEGRGDAEPMEHPFRYIITRPSEMIWDRPSRKKLAASKSLPGPFPVTNIDLAEFSLNALKSEKLYDTCPYVVQDGI